MTNEEKNQNIEKLVSQLHSVIESFLVELVEREEPKNSELATVLLAVMVEFSAKCILFMSQIKDRNQTQSEVQSTLANFPMDYVSKKIMDSAFQKNQNTNMGMH